MDAEAECSTPRITNWTVRFDPELVQFSSLIHNLFPLPHTVRVNKSRRMRWAGNVARMGETGNSYKLFV
jgi:hypothetical protein